MDRRALTFLFTDLEASTRHWQEDEEGMSGAVARHDLILREVVTNAGGRVLKHMGDGVVAVFEDPRSAAEAAVAAQRRLRSDPDAAHLLRARMGLHAGVCTERDGDFFGPTLNRAARIMSAGHGGQILASSTVTEALGDAFPLLDLGRHRLRDLLDPEPLHQVVVDDIGAYPPLRSLDAFDHNLPAQRTRLVGREDDVAAVRELLATAKLVSLVGMGGVGKTRLALEVAAQELDHRAGAIFVDLAPVLAPEQVAGALASAAGLPPEQSTEESAAVFRLLVGRPMLVVLDNCEHLVEACAELAEAVLDRCPQTSLLVTSREPLGVDAERVWRVPSLPAATSAAELFRDRAAAAGGNLPDDADTDQLLTELCERLDGIPLAIELAASRTAHLSLAELADRLEQRFQLLTGGTRRRERTAADAASDLGLEL